MLSKEILEEEYIKNQKSCPKIAKETGFSTRTIHSWLVKYNIPRRDNSKASSKIDMIGIKVGNLEVIKPALNKKANQATWTVRCNQCQIEFDLPGWKIRHRQIGGCRNCGKHPNFRGYKDIYKNYWTKLKKNAKDRNLEFSISIEEAWNLYEKQNRKCALSGMPIFFERSKGQSSEKTASLDRIDSTKGYIFTNIQWLHKDVNKLKGIFSDSYVIELANNISNYRKGQQY